MNYHYLKQVYLRIPENSKISTFIYKKVEEIIKISLNYNY